MPSHCGQVCKLQGPHFGKANACSKKKAACGDTKGWRTPSPKWRQRGETSRPEDPPATAEGDGVDEVDGYEVWNESNSGEGVEE